MSYHTSNLKDKEVSAKSYSSLDEAFAPSQSMLDLQKKVLGQHTPYPEENDQDHQAQTINNNLSALLDRTKKEPSQNSADHIDEVLDSIYQKQPLRYPSEPSYPVAYQNSGNGVFKLILLLAIIVAFFYGVYWFCRRNKA